MINEPLFDVVPASASPAGAGTALRVMGLDLSITSPGICLPEGTAYRIRTRQTDGDRRLSIIRDAVAADIDAYRPQLVVIEDLPFTAQSAGATGMVQGVVRAVIADAGIPRALVSPATLKSYACNYGRATKQQMADAANNRARVVFHGDLTPAGHGGDMCDAWWLRAAGLDWWGAPEFFMPAVQRAFLDKARWPDREAVTGT